MRSTHWGSWNQSAEADLGRGASGRESGAAFGTAGIDDLTTATSRHAGAESVGPGTLDSAGLKSAFHCRCLSIGR